MATNPIVISASCVATFLNASPGSRLRKLIPFKYKNVGEGAGRSGYYRPMISAVPEFHRTENEFAVFQRVISEMTLIEQDRSLLPIQRSKGRSNIDAIRAYYRIYGERRFEFLPRRRLWFTIDQVMVTAQPDMWVIDETGKQVIFKIGAAKSKPRDYIDFMLHLMRKAAAAQRERIGARISSKNIVWLNVATGEEVISHLPLTHFNRTIENACREISQLWPLVPDPTVPRGRETEGFPSGREHNEKRPQTN